ncbi:hypothetical protein CR513_49468, partial [Mucuna pruriens]
MESNTAVIAKRVWNIIRVAFFMLRKSISKGKLMMHLNVMLKRRGNLAGKANDDRRLQFSAAREYEFSCSNTPNNFFAKRHRHNPFFACTHAPPTLDDDLLKGVLEMLNNEAVVEASPSPSAAPLPELGRSPMVVRQLRVTDSPFPLRDSEDDKDNHVDKAAEDFIKRFYKDLKKQT